MKKKILCGILAVVMLLMAVPAFASESTATTSGSCKKAYSTSATLSNSTGGWTSFQFVPNASTEISYSSTGSYATPTYSGHVYGYARPQGTDGTAYGTAFKVYKSHTTTWTPNDSGRSASTAKFKIYNALYFEYSYTSSKMTMPSSTIKGIY